MFQFCFILINMLKRVIKRKIRPQKVTVRAQDRHGKVFELTGEDLLARALCHEIDHLDGKMYVDIEDHEIVEEEDEEEQE